MPLGLELAAAWIDFLSLADIAAEIRQNLDFLTTENYNVPDRHRSIRAVFDTTWQRLTETEQQIFAQLSIFRGGFARDAAQVAVGSPLRTLASLTSKSLLHYNNRADHYEIHDLLRQCAAEQLAALIAVESAIAAVADRHSAYYCTFLHQRETDLKGPRQREVMAEIELESENIRVAWQWAVEGQHIVDLGRALESWSIYLLRRGRIQEGE
jgi:predicted ATPase